MWITLTEDDVKTRLAGAELSALKSAALSVGQSDPLPEILAQIVAEVRGYVAACSHNVLGEEGTIPSELALAALNRIRYELATRLPVASLLTEARVESNRGAIAQLKEVAACRFALVPPTSAAPAAEQAGGASAALVSSRTREASRYKLRGL